MDYRLQPAYDRTPNQTHGDVTMRTCLALLLLQFYTITCFAAQTDFTKIEKLMRSSRLAWRAPGIAIAIVDHDKIDWHGADGYENLESNAPATTATVWRIASLSKPITATAVMQLVEQNKIQLSDTMWKYLSWYPLKQNNHITILHLLTHTSGIRHYHDNEKINTQHFHSIKDSAHIYKIDQEPLRFTPGKQYLYSTYGYALLAGVIENASGLVYGDYLKEYIFQPAGMNTARLDLNEAIIPHRADHYLLNYYGKLVHAPYVDVSYKWAGGGILASIDDIAKFAIALDKGILVKPSTAKTMYQPYLLKNGSTSGYGIGWHIENDKQGRHWIYHSGAATGGATFLLRQPENGIAIAIACNLEHPGDLKSLAMKIANQL